MNSQDPLQQLRTALKTAYPTDSEVITLIRQLSTLEGILYGAMRQHPDVARSVEVMVSFYQEKAV
jgi:hypothetical protein